VTRSRFRRLGTDRVVLDDERLLVISAVDMEGWEVRQHRARVIRFEERTWRVAGKTTGAENLIHYELVPWTPGEQDVTGPEIEYNSAYVAHRDSTRVAERKRGRTTGLLRYASPIIGFLPARTKARLERDHGIDPVETTFHSVFLEFLFAVCCLTVSPFISVLLARTPVFTLLGGLKGTVAMLVAIGAVVGIDGFVRYGRILSEERPPPGFYEWLFRKRRGVD
jgi:hypothetical protein